MLLTRSWRRQRLILMRIVRTTCSTACHASVVMLPVIPHKIVIMIAHSAYVTTAALQHVHGASRLDCCRCIVSTVSTVRYTLVFDSDVCYFWEKPWLVIHINLVLVVYYIQLGGSNSV
jgi:hypothetical protein